MGIGAPAQLRDEATFWRRLTAVIVVSGLLITTMVAALQRQAAQRERDLRFEAEASRVAVLLEERIDERLGSFGSAINFIGATHPGPLDEYEAFMRNEVEQTQSADPGVMFFEFVDVDEIDELEAREAAIGNDFSVTLFPGPTEERVVLTRLAYESQLFGVSLLGLDATGLRGSLIPDDFGSQDFELYVLESDDIFDFVAAEAPPEEDFGRYSVVMLATVRNGAGSVLGWVTSIMTVDDAIGLATISDETDLSFTLRVADFEEAVGASSGWATSTERSLSLATERTVETAGLAGRLVGGRLPHVPCRDDRSPSAGRTSQPRLGPIRTRTRPHRCVDRLADRPAQPQRSHRRRPCVPHGTTGDPVLHRPGRLQIGQRHRRPRAGRSGAAPRCQ